MVAAVKGVRCSVLGIAVGGIFKWYATPKNLRETFSSCITLLKDTASLYQLYV